MVMQHKQVPAADTGLQQTTRAYKLTHQPSTSK